MLDVTTEIAVWVGAIHARGSTLAQSAEFIDWVHATAAKVMVDGEIPPGMKQYIAELHQFRKQHHITH